MYYYIVTFKINNGANKFWIAAKGNFQLHRVDYHCQPYRGALASRYNCQELPKTVSNGCGELILERRLVRRHLNGGVSRVQGSESTEFGMQVAEGTAGLQHVHRQCYAKIHEFLENEFGFKSHPHEHCLYVKHSGDYMLLIALYVDGLLTDGDNASKLKLVKDEFYESSKV